MYDEDLLDRWSRRYGFADGWYETPDGKDVPDLLDDLEQRLDQTGAGKKRPDVKVSFYDWISLQESARERAQRLYHQLVETGGTGVTSTQKGLLDLIGRAALTGSVFFWEGLVGLKGHRDRFVSERRRYAVAGLAFLVMQHDLEPARAAVLRLTDYKEPEVRRLALEMLVRASLTPDAPAPEDLVATLNDAAQEDRNGLVRYTVHRLLGDLKLEVPMDHPGGVYRIQVLPHGRRRNELVVDVRSDQTLAHLHGAIQRGLSWDDDHLYAFYISGEPFDGDTAYNGPAHACDPPYAEDIALGQLGLVTGFSFLYLFDFGDRHEMPVKVLEVQEEADRGRYPKIVKKPSSPPEQYPIW